MGGVDLGVSLKAYHQAVESASGSGVTVDVGLLWAPEGRPLRLGLVGRDVAGQVSYSTGSTDAFDATWVTGASYRLGALSLALDKELPGPVRVGLEYQASPAVALRAGASSDGRWSLSGGIGVRVGPFAVDYAYEQPPVLDGTHRLALGVSF